MPANALAEILYQNDYFTNKYFVILPILRWKKNRISVCDMTRVITISLFIARVYVYYTVPSDSRLWKYWRLSFYTAKLTLIWSRTLIYDLPTFINLKCNIYILQSAYPQCKSISILIYNVLRSFDVYSCNIYFLNLSFSLTSRVKRRKSQKANNAISFF